MSSVEEYRRRIDALSRIVIRANTVQEAKAALADVRETQTRLRLVKREINLDMKQIRASYAAKAESAGSGGAALFTLTGKRGYARSHQAAARRGVRAERDRVLAPYESMKVTIDDLLVQLDRAKLQLQNYLDQRSG